MTIKKEIKKSVWLITDHNSLPIKLTEYKKLIKDKLEFMIVKDKLVKWCNNNY